MKKRIMILCLLSVLILSACGGNDTKVIESNAKTKEVEDNIVLNSESETLAGELESNETDYKGYTYTYENVLISIDTEADSIIESLGEPDSYFESPSCAFEGIDKIYTYGSIQIETYPLNEKDYISAIVFMDDSIVTTEGVGIGDSIDQLIEIYGAGYTEESGMIMYEKDGVKLCFVMQDGSVASIEYRSMVLDEPPAEN